MCVCVVAPNGPVLPPNGENNKGEENLVEDPLHAAGRVGPEKSKQLHFLRLASSTGFSFVLTPRLCKIDLLLCLVFTILSFSPSFRLGINKILSSSSLGGAARRSEL